VKKTIQVQKYILLLAVLFSSELLFGSSTFKVLTFNCWAVELPIPKKVYEVSLQIDERLRMLPTKAVELGADIVVLQEVWKEYRKTDLIKSFSQIGYPYAVYKYPAPGGPPYRGALGNGLLIISKFPLDPNSEVMKFSEYTRADEYFTFKGAIKTKVNIPQLGWVDLFDSHLGAYTTEPKSKNDPKPDHYNQEHLQKKLSQAHELANFINGKRSSEVVIVAMDMNTHYQTFLDGKMQNSFAPEYTLMTCSGAKNNEPCLGLADSFRAVHGFTNPPAWTYDTQLNDYAKGGVFASEPQEVIDYIFLNNNAKVSPVASQIVFNERSSTEDQKRFGLKTLPPFLSDHYGVLTTFEVH
jgi:hypothetical protein